MDASALLGLLTTAGGWSSALVVVLVWVDLRGRLRTLQARAEERADGLEVRLATLESHFQAHRVAGGQVVHLGVERAEGK